VAMEFLPASTETVYAISSAPASDRRNARTSRMCRPHTDVRIRVIADLARHGLSPRASCRPPILVLRDLSLPAPSRRELRDQKKSTKSATVSLKLLETCPHQSLVLATMSFGVSAWRLARAGPNASTRWRWPSLRAASCATRSPPSCSRSRDPRLRSALPAQHAARPWRSGRRHLSALDRRIDQQLVPCATPTRS